MAAYIVAQVEVTDPERFRHYQELARPAVEKYGGRFLASSEAPVRLEGDWSPQRVVLVEFDSLAQCRAFYDSPDYRRAIEARLGAARLDILAVDGL